METKTIYVAYENGEIKFFDEQEVEFNGDVVCPPEGRIFQFLPKAGSSGWEFSGFSWSLTSGPDEAAITKRETPQAINVTDSGNGNLSDDSIYDYTVSVTTTGGEGKLVDPKIKNTGGGMG